MIMAINGTRGGYIVLTTINPKVAELGNRTVSWLQVEGLHIISAGKSLIVIMI